MLGVIACRILWPSSVEAGLRGRRGGYGGCCCCCCGSSSGSGGGGGGDDGCGDGGDGGGAPCSTGSAFGWRGPTRAAPPAKPSAKHGETRKSGVGLRAAGRGRGRANRVRSPIAPAPQRRLLFKLGLPQLAPPLSLWSYQLEHASVRLHHLPTAVRRAQPRAQPFPHRGPLAVRCCGHITRRLNRREHDSTHQ